MLSHRNILALSSALLASAVTLSAGTAAAQTCPTPTVVQCRDPNYLATPCGQAATADDTSSCSVQLKAAYQTATQQPNVPVAEVMVPDQPGVTTAAAAQPYSFFNHLARNFNSQFMGTEQRSQLLTASGGSINLISDGVTLFGLTNLQAVRNLWANNGNAVQSCEEATYERYYGYTSFKDAADVQLLSDQALFSLAFDPAHGIASRTLYSKSGLSALPPVTFPSNGVIGTITIGGHTQPLIDPRSPKNGFFKAYKSLARGSFFPVNDPTRLKLQQGQSHHVVNWAWHQQMQTALSPAYDAETLRYYEDRQSDFLRLAAERDQVLDLIAKFGNTMTSGATIRDLGAELAALESSLWTELRAADADGCLDPTNVTKCDWSYRQLRDQVAAYYSKLMEGTYQTCVANTGDDFSAGAVVHHAGTTFGAPKEDYATVAEDVENLGTVIASWVAAQNFPKDPVTQQPMVGGGKHDSGTLGSSSMSLDWAYNADWKLDVKDVPTCQASITVDGSFSATGHAFGTDVPIIDATATVTTAQSVAKADVKLDVMGVTVWHPTDNPSSADLSAGFVKDLKSSTSKEFTTTVYPFGIPVTLGAGVGMAVGLKLDMKAAIGGGCNSTPTTVAIDLASVKGTVTPYAQADAFASAAVGIPGFRAGLKCDLIVVRGQMPISADAAIAMSPSKAVTASVTMSGQQTFHMLDGSVKAFVDGPIDALDGQWTIFSWQGPTIDQQLFSFSKSNLPLDAIKTALGS